jgi:hypothetical protein
MSEEGKAPHARSWQEVAAELIKETDQARITALILELEIALAERDKGTKRAESP